VHDAIKDFFFVALGVEAIEREFDRIREEKRKIYF